MMTTQTSAVGDNGQAFTQITNRKVVQVLGERDAFDYERVDQKRADLRNTKEYVYEADVHDMVPDIISDAANGRLAHRVYTSCWEEGGDGRGCGRDSIKQTVVLYPEDGSHPLPVHREPRTHRIRSADDEDRWMVNLDKKLNAIEETLNNGNLVVCKESGHLMCIRDGDNGEFWGCTDYPRCTHTEPYNDPEQECPECGSHMIKREGEYGEFWGCSQYPDCDETVPVDDD